MGPIWNPPRAARYNGVVERSQDIGQDWGEPQTCASAAELQARLDEFDRKQRDQYPAIGGLTRRQAYSGLSHSGRPYSRRWEQQHWDLGLVLAWLSEHPVPRLVDVNGKVSVYDRGLWVGREHSGRTVWVGLDPDTVDWVIMAEKGPELRRVPAKELTPERIQALSISRQRGPGRRGQTT